MVRKQADGTSRYTRPGLGEMVAIGMILLGGLVWSVRLEGRVNTQAEQIATLKQQQVDSIEQVRHDLTYIRARLDQVLDTERRSMVPAR